MARPTRRGFFDLPLELREMVYAEICTALAAKSAAIEANKEEAVRLQDSPGICYRGCCYSFPPNSRIFQPQFYGLGTYRLVSRNFGHEMLGVWAEATAHAIPLRLEFWRYEHGPRRPRNTYEYFITSSRLAFGIWVHLRDYLDELCLRFGRSGADMAARIRHVKMSREFNGSRALHADDAVATVRSLDPVAVARHTERLDGLHKNLRVEVEVTCSPRPETPGGYTVGSLGPGGERQWKVGMNTGRRTFVLSPMGQANEKQETGAFDGGAQAVAAEWQCVLDEPVRAGILMKKGWGCEEKIEWAKTAS
ncbi:hypothetical protein LTR17_003814 [Elasticomyces elasticus]|nr:hypothetical protein LTR17_003814 [Elasticomyces elasticus]